MKKGIQVGLRIFLIHCGQTQAISVANTVLGSHLVLMPVDFKFRQ